jgi:NADH-quinone oxidoreductase subunit M
MQDSRSAKTGGTSGEVHYQISPEDKRSMIPELHFPWLEFSIVIPMIGAVICGLMKDPVRAQRIAVVCGSLTLFCTTGEWLDFATLSTWEAHDHWDVIQWIFHRDFFVIDELSAPLLPVAALLYLMTMLSTLRTKVLGSR